MWLDDVMTTWMMGKNMAARNGGILKSLLKIVVRQSLDDKYGSKLAATVSIDQKYSFKCFHSKLLLELMFFLKKM